MKLSRKSIEDLKQRLLKEYGDTLVSSLSEDELNQIGILLLTSLAESLKLQIARPELSTSK